MTSGSSDRPIADPRFFFESVSHRHALAWLAFGLARGEGIVAIVGDAGTGKSRLAAHWLASLGVGMARAVYCPAEMRAGREIAAGLVNAFGLPPGPDPIGQLAAFLRKEAWQGRPCTVLVDDADELATADLLQLEALARLTATQGVPLSSVLLGRPDFATRLRHDPALEGLRALVIANHRLRPLRAAEVGAYVEHRLRSIGWQGEALPTETVAALADATGGNPARINPYAARLLLGGADLRALLERGGVNAAISEIEACNAATADLAPPLLRRAAGDSSCRPKSPGFPVTCGGLLRTGVNKG